VTIPELLKPQGYTSILIGKWHLGHAPGYLPTDQGFDAYFGVPGTNHGDSLNHGLPVAEGFQPGDGLTMEDYEKDAGGKKGTRTILMRDDKVIEWPTDISRLTTRYTQEAVKFIRRNREAPFFLYLAHGTPHHPYTVSQEFEGTSAHGRYGDMIEEIDWSVGEVSKALEKHGLDENTLVIFTSDNGADGKPDKEHPEQGSCLPLRDWKSSNYEGGSRVPFVARWPGQLPAGETIDEMASLLDMLPTFAALAGAEVDTPQKIDGKDIWGMLAKGEPSPQEYLYYGGNGSIAAIRNHTFKYFPGKRDNPGVLYNLKSDIAETTNVVESHPEVARTLAAALEAFQLDLDQNSLEAPVNTAVKKYGDNDYKKETPQK
jgi:arylsulfatase A